MKIVDAVWERRNLGVSTQEVTIEHQDVIEDIMDTIKCLTAQYQVIKIPTGMIQAMWSLEDNGFRYVETVINVTYDLSQISLPEHFKRINNVIEYCPMGSDDMEQMYDEIRNGMFNTDRVAIDPTFSIDQASDRYTGWLHDEESRGTPFYKYVYKNKTVGFFALKKITEKTFYPFLAGIYNEYRRTPIGAVYLYKPLLEAKRLGGKTVSTYVSLNNFGAIRVHVDYGFVFKESYCVFVKHGESKC